jgi:putative FmdB family regulatory protein
MPLNDYICECGVISERIVKYEDEDKQECPRCKKIMTKQMNFKLVYNNKTDMVSWGAEGYARSQYWDAVKKQKEEEGKITMPVTENIK